MDEKFAELARRGDGSLVAEELAAFRRKLDADQARVSAVRRLFDGAASDYDRVASLMALGSGTRYRRGALVRSGLARGMRVLDVATGTGLVAREALRLVGPGGNVTGVDVSAGMLARAAATLPVRLVQGLGEALPFRAAQFDFVSLGYALRHLDQPTTFAEMLRVLRPGGSVCILEISAPAVPILRQALGMYIGRVVPLVARLVGARPVTRELWRYFWHTVDHALPPAAVLQNLAAAGFGDARRHLVQGVFVEYTARTPAATPRG
jgi:demethylmenaquinone methyltransferase/2-methoxy-6-polyprenyl-1,4-benzoquinol methylase